jgi:hypothetical protein
VIVAASGGHGWGLAVFPLLAGTIAGVFSLVLLLRFGQRRRPHEGVWALALMMYAVASFAMYLGVVAGWTVAEFKAYWLFGAILNVPFLFMGEAYLLARRRPVAHALFAVLVILAVGAAWVVVRAPVHPRPLAAGLPLGKDVFGAGTSPHRLAQFYSIPAYFLLLGGLLWSAAQMRGRPELRNRTAGTVLIAIGATVVAVGSGIGAAFDVVPLFSASLTAGIALMFYGFLQAGRPVASNA